MKKNTPLIKERFSSKGWHLERSVLENDVVIQAREFLDARRKNLQTLFSDWIGHEVNEENYGSYQAKLPIYEKQGISKNLRHFLTGEFDLETRMNKCLIEILSTQRCSDFLRCFLETDRYYIHYPPMVRFKLAGAESSLVPIHQDAPYNTHLSDFVTVWVPLVDIDEDCGGLIVYEGSHATDLVKHEASGAWSNKASIDTSAYSARHVLMSAGDALLFPPTFLHESAPHRSKRIRYSIDFRVIKNTIDTTKSFYDPFEKLVTTVEV